METRIVIAVFREVFLLLFPYMSKHIALIMAKSGSQGLPGKNTLMWKKKTLLEHCIDDLKKSNCFDEIYISTNGYEIGKLAAKLTGTVLWREDNLAANERYIDAVNQALAQVDSFETVTIPQIVQPLREPELFQKLLSLHKPGIDSVVTVTRFESSTDWIFSAENGKLSKSSRINYTSDIARRNDLYIIDNAVVSFTFDSWKRQDGITTWPYLGQKIVPYIQQFLNPNYFVDINGPEDAEWLEFVTNFPEWRENRSEY